MRQILDTEISRYIWETRYRWMRGGEVLDESIEDTWRRVAGAAAQVETDPALWREGFLSILQDFRFLPGGRILAGAGTDLRVTLCNCFVMGTIKDDMASIFEGLKEGALTMQAGGGVGYDFSTLRPRGFVARSSANIASGPVSYMHVWNAMCDTLLSTGARRGAMIASLRCDHPDIEQFIDAKRSGGALNHFNLSVQVPDAFMRAVDAGEDWLLVFPVVGVADGQEHEVVMRDWPGYEAPVACAVIERKPARDLWQRIMRANYETAEPGVLFVDRINGQNNLAYRERISCTNPCGEVPLPPYGACNLGSVNLTRFVTKPFSGNAGFDLAGIRATATIAARFLDDIIDCSQFPLPQQAEQARGSRRIGLGITGLADALIMAGLHYGSEAARRAAVEVMETICHAAYRSSIALAAEKGAFPFFEAGAYVDGNFVRALPADIVEGIAGGGIRNSHLIAIAPTGTISLLAGNLSSGIEPVFDFRVSRNVQDRQGNLQRFELEDYAFRRWKSSGHADGPLPAFFVSAQTLLPEQQIRMQSALQPFVDNAISKTVNVPEACSFDDFQELYRFAWHEGLKGCTTFRQNSRREEVLSPEGRREAALNKCCVLE